MQQPDISPPSTGPEAMPTARMGSAPPAILDASGEDDTTASLSRQLRLSLYSTAGIVGASGISLLLFGTTVAGAGALVGAGVLVAGLLIDARAKRRVRPAKRTDQGKPFEQGTIGAPASGDRDRTFVFQPNHYVP